MSDDLTAHEWLSEKTWIVTPGSDFMIGSTTVRTQERGYLALGRIKEYFWVAYYGDQWRTGRSEAEAVGNVVIEMKETQT